MFNPPKPALVLVPNGDVVLAEPKPVFVEAPKAAAGFAPNSPPPDVVGALLVPKEDPKGDVVDVVCDPNMPPEGFEPKTLFDGEDEGAPKALVLLPTLLPKRPPPELLLVDPKALVLVFEEPNADPVLLEAPKPPKPLEVFVLENIDN